MHRDGRIGLSNVPFSTHPQQHIPKSYRRQVISRTATSFSSIHYSILSKGDVMKSFGHKSFLIIAAVWLFLRAPGGAYAQNDAIDLRTNVIAALDRYSTIPLDVRVNDQGRVLIKGDVDRLFDKLEIYQAVSRVKGVTAIENLVNVDSEPLPGEMVKADILEGMRDNSVILEPDKINITVNDGLVFLQGIVSYENEKVMAETISSMENGVVAIENDLVVLSPKKAETDENLLSVIDEIVKNQFPLIQDMVDVKVDHGDVTVGGEVNTLWEMENLKQECLKVSGVKNVTENVRLKAGI
jgi:osmotically-inducible protein OsmY